MQEKTARITTRCPSCGEQIVTRVRFPVPAHSDVKRPILEEWEHAAGCDIDEQQVLEMFRL